MLKSFDSWKLSVYFDIVMVVVLNFLLVQHNIYVHPDVDLVLLNKW